jgi:hypothetical protein
MYNRLIRYVDKFNLLTEVQHGLRKGKSTETVSQSFIEHIQEALDNHYHVVGIFLDLTKAYDVVNHDILLNKLDSYGIIGVSKLWFKSYLTNRIQFVEIIQVDEQKHTHDRYLSAPRKTICGVPQGSILGPILFLLYINDLNTYVIDVQMILYADDTNILIMDKNEESLKVKLASIMKQLEVWFYNNELILNMEKSKVMSFYSRHCQRYCSPNIIYSNMEITYSSVLKFLGLTITNNLNWKTHIQTLCVYYILKSLKGVMSLHTIKTIYFAYFQTRMKYGIAFWGTDCDSVKVFHMLKKVIRLIAGVKYLNHIDRFLRILKF